MRFVVLISFRPGPELRKFQTCSASGTFEGEQLSGDVKEATSQIPRVLTGLQSALTKRFTDINEGVLKATKIADLTSWPAVYEDAISKAWKCLAFTMYIKPCNFLNNPCLFGVLIVFYRFW